MRAPRSSAVPTGCRLTSDQVGRGRGAWLAGAAATLALTVVSSCAPVVVAPGPPKGVAVGGRCMEMQETCREAEQLEREYRGLPPDEQEDMKQVLAEVRQQCAEASQACRKQQPK